MRVLPLTLTLSALALFGCAPDAVVVGELLSTDEPPPPRTVVPLGQGGGPPAQAPDICHPDPGDLGEPSEVPEGFAAPDHSETSPAHPLHLDRPKTRRFEDRI